MIDPPATRSQPPVSAYPARWAVDAVLADGATVSIRPIRPGDGPALIAFHEGLSAETVYRRFFAPRPHLSEREVEHFTHVDYRDRMAFVAVLGDQFIGVAGYERIPDTEEAEIACVVADAHQGRGLGTLFLEYLAAAAGEFGIARFVADTLSTNRQGLEVLRTAGWRQATSHDQETIHVVLDIRPTDAARGAAEQREWTADVRSIARLLRPRSVTVVAAGSRGGSIGNTLLGNLRRSGFDGPVYPVNPHATATAGLAAYPSVDAIPGEVDLAVIAVPAAAAVEVVDACAAKGVHGLVVVSSGFSETGAPGAALERELVEHAHRGGMRLIGPNCLGVISTTDSVRLNATFACHAAPRGSIAFASQSTPVGIALLERAERMGLGISDFVSLGNRADVSSNDLLRYWQQDANSRVILLYLESFGNPRVFSRVARRVSRSTPIVVVKARRGAAEASAASSHSAALASPDAAVDALFQQSGVIRVDTLEELFDVGGVLAHQPLPAGGRVAVVGNAGRAGVLATDALSATGLEVAELSDAVCATLRASLPTAAAVVNPVDLGAGAAPQLYQDALRTLLDTAQIDSAMVIHAPVPGTSADEVARAICAATGSVGKPVVTTFLGMQRPPSLLSQQGERVPCFAFPEAAARALGSMTRYAQWRARPEGRVTQVGGIDLGAARALVEAELETRPEGGWLGARPAAALLSACSIPVLATVQVRSADAAVRAARELGFPVALKVAGRRIVHRSDVGGVHLDLRTAATVRRAYAAIAQRAGAAMEGAIVQPMAPPGVEVIVGVVHDATFGPLVMFGSGGTAVELLGDRALRVLPLTDLDVSDLVRSIRGAPLLFGYRGAPRVDVAALQDLILCVARLAEDVPELAEMDLNPVIVCPEGVRVVDAKVRIAAWTPQAELTVRHLASPATRKGSALQLGAHTTMRGHSRGDDPSVRSSATPSGRLRPA